MEYVEFAELSLRDWVGMIGHGRSPFGPAAADLTYRPKDRYVGVRDGEGRLLAAVGAAIATVEVGDLEPFEVVGLGGLIVREDARRLGLGTGLMDRIRTIMDGMGPDLAMLFCEAELMPLYAGRGYAPLRAPVCADQPEGRILMPTPAMWRALRPAEWPPGPVRVHGYPF